MPDPDAIVIGSGPNGLVAANLLTDAGWDVLVLEAQPRVGGAVASDSSVLEGYVHDTFSLVLSPRGSLADDCGAQSRASWPGVGPRARRRRSCSRRRTLGDPAPRQERDGRIS